MLYSEDEDVDNERFNNVEDRYTPELPTKRGRGRPRKLDTEKVLLIL